MQDSAVGSEIQTMKPPRYLAFILLVPLLGVGWLVLATVEPDRGSASEPLRYIILGNLIGGVFGQATLAATWCVLGPLHLTWRLPLSVAWIVALIMALGLNIGLNGGPDEIVFTLGACLCGQWLALQIPLWWLALTYGLQVRHWSDEAHPSEPVVLQFGIRQLMILTAIVAVLLGLGRVAVPTLAGFAHFDRETPIFIFLAVAGVVMTLPLVLATLLPRLAIAATLAVLLTTALVTASELPLMNALGAGGGGPDLWHFICINGFQAAWVLAVSGVLRFGGYRLSSAR